jgi:large subunit ribosomal protein L9
MKVILVQDVPGLGEEGDNRDVTKGYARNYLLPKGYAVPDTPFNRNRMKAQQKKIELRKVKKREDAQSLADQLSAITLSINAAVGKNEKLFGAVHEADIMKALAEQGYTVDKKDIQLKEPIKQTGVYTVPVKIYEDIKAELKVLIGKEE